MQVAGVARPLRELAHDLYPHEPLGKAWRAGKGVRGTPATASGSYQSGGGLHRQHIDKGASRRNGRVKKNGEQSIGKSRGGWTTKIHLIAADARIALDFSLSPGQASDGPEGRKLLASWGVNRPKQTHNVLMDRAYEGDETRQLVFDLGMIPVVPPKKNRLSPWEYDREMYKRRNEVERLFRRLKGFRRIFSRFEKLDVMFTAFIHFALAGRL